MPAILSVTRNALALILLCCGATLAGCSGSDDPADPADPGATQQSTEELRAEVGPEGGTLEGAQDTVFAGLKLEIPPGALAAKATIVIRPTFDPTPLPNLAERVGDQFTIEGGALSSPVTLTLPVDAAKTRRFEQKDSDVKVWVRAGEGWKLSEATATARGSVTIALDAFTTAAAGVKVLAQPTFCVRFPQSASCGTSPPPPARPVEIPLSQPCNVPEPYCLSKIAAAVPAPESLDNFEVNSDAIYYLFGESVNQVNTARVELNTGAISQPLKGHATTSTARRNMAIDGANVWVGLGPGAGNVMLRPKILAEVSDTDRHALGAVQIPNGPFLRLDNTSVSGIPTLEVSARSGTSFGPRKQVALFNGDGTSTRVKADPAGGALWAMQSLHMRRATVAADGSMTSAGSFALNPEGEDFYVDFAPNTTGRVAVLLSTQFGYHENASAPFVKLDVGPVFDAAFLTASPLIATSASSPELFVELGASNLPKRILLTDAASTDPEYTSRIPRGIRGIPGTTSAVFLTQGREFYVLRISTSTIL